jgi:CDP-paratose 2-epimerase
VGVAIVTGSAGLIGSEAARHFAGLGLEVVGIDNDMRRYYFGEDGTTRANRDRLVHDLGASYHHVDRDVRDRDGVWQLFARYGHDVVLVIHAAAQPSHDWAAREPATDFDVNAVDHAGDHRSTFAS